MGLVAAAPAVDRRRRRSSSAAVPRRCAIRSRHTEGNSALGVARFGVIDRSGQVKIRNAQRTDMPTPVFYWTWMRNCVSRSTWGIKYRSWTGRRPHPDDRFAGTSEGVSNTPMAAEDTTTADVGRRLGNHTHRQRVWGDFTANRHSGRHSSSAHRHTIGDVGMVCGRTRATVRSACRVIKTITQ